MITNIQEYIQDFTDRAEELAQLKLESCPELEDRRQQVSDLLEQYYNTVGANPKSIVLENLASYLLADDLKNKDVDKVTNTEYPILSDIQLKRRTRKQPAMQVETLDFLNSKFHRQIDSMSKKQAKKVEY